jgi:hypothetical protein
MLVPVFMSRCIFEVQAGPVAVPPGIKKKSKWTTVEETDDIEVHIDFAQATRGTFLNNDAPCWIFPKSKSITLFTDG